jgi:hypothetical protein
MIICAVRGCVEALSLSHFHRKALITSGCDAFIFIIVPLCTNFKFCTRLLQCWKKALPFFFIYIFVFAERRLWSTLLTPFVLYFFFSGSASKFYKLCLVLFSVALCCLEFEARAPFAKFALSIGCMFALDFFQFINNKILKTGLLVGFALPVIMFYLAVSGIFDVLNFKEYLDPYEITSSSSGEEVNLAADTRSFIYAEVLGSAVENDYVIQGRSFARGNDSYYALDLYDGINLKERFMNEVSLLNIFTWEGLIGVILYSLIYIFATVNAINKSRNKYLKVMAVSLSFIWAFSWVEIINTFDMCYVTFLIMLGMCMSPVLLDMKDYEFERWAFQFLPCKKG